MALKVLAGFHAVQARMRHAAHTIKELYVEAQRRDKRMTALVDQARAHQLSVNLVDKTQLDELAQGVKHQGVIARVQASELALDVDELLDELEEAGKPPLLLILDGVTDPHNLGACLRTADAAGCHAVIAPKDRAVGLTAAVERVACGAAETVPYITVTNLARTLRKLKDRGVWLYGMADQATQQLYQVDAKGPMAWVMGAEGEGMRRLTREVCDELVAIPMLGSVESLNVSVASAICLYESVRQRQI